MTTGNNPKDILERVFAIVGDKERSSQLADRFIAAFQKQAWIDLMAQLPREGQETIQVLRQHVGEQDYAEALEKATRKAFANYLEEIVPHLSLDQKRELEQYLSSVSEQLSTWEVD